MTASPCSALVAPVTYGRAGAPTCLRGVSAVSESRHRELGLTDSEYELHRRAARPRPERRRAGDVLACSGPSTAPTSTRGSCSRRLPDRGRAGRDGPGRERRAPSTSATATRSRSRSSPTTTRARSSHSRARRPASAGSCRDVFAIGARPIAVLDSLRFGELDSERSRYLLDGAVAGSATTATRSASRPSAARSTSSRPTSTTASSTRCASGSPRTDEMVRAAAAGPATLVVLMGASTGRDGIGGASVLASAELERGRRREAARACRSATRSRSRSCSSAASSCSSSGLLVSLQDLGAAGPDLVGRRDGLQRAASGSTSTSAGCRCARRTWSRSRSWSPSPRSGCWRSSSRRRLDDGDRGLRALADRRRGDRRRHRHRPAAGARRRRRGRRDVPVAALVDECPLYDLEPERAGRVDVRQPTADARRPGASADRTIPRRSSARCSPPRTSPRSAGPSSSTTPWWARAPRGARGRRCRGPDAA